MKEKKAIHIYTLNGYFNYGNRLQLFALTKSLSKITDSVKIKTYWQKSITQKLKELIKYYTPLALLNKKERKLKRFTRKYIGAETSISNADIKIVGSDQVFNPDYIKKHNYLPLNDGVKTVSYAASIGKSNLSKTESSFLCQKIKQYEKISVREKTAKETLQPLLQEHDIEVVLDPTLLLEKQEYERLEKKPRNLSKKEKYILCYILGNHDHETIIDIFAKKQGYKTIYFSDKPDSDYGVEEFLYLIHHAELICTDSFHACVFSFIFERPFVAFRRSGKANYMYTRLQNLINTFKLKNREFNGTNITKENLETDYSEAKKILKKEQEKSLNFLKEALGE